MAISLHTAGAWAAAASGSVTTTLPTHSTGDMLLVRVVYKSSAIATCTASTATSGWAKLGEFHSGTNNSGNGIGSVAAAVFWKIAASAAETNPTIDFSQTITVVGHVALSYQLGGGETWDTPVGDGGADTTNSFSVSATIQSHVSTTSGDMVDFFFGVWDNTVITVPTFTQASLTLDTVSEQPDTALNSTAGDDIGADGGYRLATSGTSSAAAVVTGTMSTSETQEAAWTTRLRVSAGGAVSVTPGLATLTTSLFTPTVATPRLVTPGLATLTTTRFTPTVQTPRLSTPATATLTTTRFTPTVTAPQLSVPGLATLTTTRFTPTVTVASGVSVTPGTASLTTTTFTPTVQTPRTVTPGTRALTTTRFTPAVLTPRLVTPGTASLTLTRFVSTVTAGAAISVTPGTASLVTTRYTPDVTIGTPIAGPSRLQVTVGTSGGEPVTY